MRFVLAITAAALLAVPAPVLAQQDEEGCKTTRCLSRFSGYYISDCETRDFSSYDFTCRRTPRRGWKGATGGSRTGMKEARKSASPLQLSRNYANALAPRGGVKVLENVDTAGGTATLRLPAGGKNIWVEVSISNGGEGRTR